MRENKDKPRLSLTLLMPEAQAALASAISYGEEKYTAAENRGWMKYKPSEVMDSMLRHAAAARNGELIDKESGLPHINLMLFNAAAYVELIVYCSSKGSSERSLPEDSSAC